MPDIFILGGARTPMADYTGKLKDFSAIELGAIAARGAMQRTGVEPAAVDHVVFGNVLQTSADAVYGARHVGLKAGVPVEVPALTVNRLCGSGIQAAISGAQMIRLGEADVVLTGGMESMSQAPHVIRGLRNGLRLGQGKLEDSLLSALLDTHCGCTMAATAENCAREVRHLARGQDDTRFAASSWRMPPGGAGRLRGRNRAGRNHVAQGGRGLREGRPHAPGYDARGAGEAPGRLQQGRLRHRGQRLRHRRRRRRAVARLGDGATATTA